MPDSNNTYYIKIGEPQRVVIALALSEFICNHVGSSTPGFDIVQDALHLERMFDNSACPLVIDGYINNFVR